MTSQGKEITAENHWMWDSHDYGDRIGIKRSLLTSNLDHAAEELHSRLASKYDSILGNIAGSLTGSIKNYFFYGGYFKEIADDDYETTEKLYDALIANSREFGVGIQSEIEQQIISGGLSKLKFVNHLSGKAQEAAEIAIQSYNESRRLKQLKKLRKLHIEKYSEFKKKYFSKTIDMSGAPEGSALTAFGHKRNGPWFWRQMRDSYPEYFSQDNIALIKKEKSPLIDDQWLKFHPSHKDFKGGKLIHHHIDQGVNATGFPEILHTELNDILHPFQGVKK